ncbi:hypothetical protein BOX15_Mlig004657g1, partial [Macrostomum lignano]
QSSCMELTVWPGRWDSASIDPDCLASLAYVRFSGAPVQIRLHNRPALVTSVTTSPRRLSELPRLRHAGNSINGGFNLEHLFAYLRKENYGVEYDFSEDQLVRMTALMRSTRARLAPAVAQLLWLEARVYTRVTRPAFAEAVGLPASLVYPVYRHHATRNRLLASFGYDFARVSEDALLQQVTANGVDCIDQLSQVLDQARFFVSESGPCCLDAMVFGYLWPLLKAPITQSNLSSGEVPALLRKLRQHRNLIEFCQRVQRAYFPELSSAVGSASAAGGDDASLKSGSDGAVLRNAGLFLAITSAVFGLYAWQSGWIVVQP